MNQFTLSENASLKIRFPDERKNIEKFIHENIVWNEFARKISGESKQEADIELFHEHSQRYSRLVFSPAFVHTKSYFERSLAKNYNFSKNLIESLFYAYMERLSEVSQYALFSNFKKTGLGYNKWSENFFRNTGISNYWIDIFEEFPLLLRFLCQSSSQFIEHCNEIFERFVSDRNQLNQMFGLTSSDTLEHCDVSLSDPHRQGRTVAKLTFSSGISIIYKPKDISVEKYFNDFISAHGESTGFIPLKVISLKTHGWVECADFHSNSYSEIPEKAGRAAAWLWLLNSSDMHSENIKPGKLGIYGLDLETIVTASAEPPDSRGKPEWRKKSVLSTLLFDSAISGADIETGYSGFNDKGFIKQPYASIQFIIEDEDIKIYQALPGQAISVEQSQGSPNYESFEIIIDSFKNACDELIDVAKKFIEGMPRNIPIRVVFRPTNFYHQILVRIRQPRFLRDANLAYSELKSLGVSGSLAIDTDSKFFLQKIAEDEALQLMSGDIPYFWHFSEATELFLNSGSLEKFFTCSAKKFTSEKLGHVELCDIKEQVALIAISTGRLDLAFPRSVSARNQSYSKYPILEKIGHLAKNIVDQAFIPSSGIARWICSSGGVDSKKLQIDANDTSFFSGSLGVLFALNSIESLLNKIGSQLELTDFLDSQALSWSKYLRSNSNTKKTPQCLGLIGVGGELFSFSFMYYQNPKRWFFLKSELHNLLNIVQKDIENDEWLDILAGAAGVILGCHHVILYGPSCVKQKALDVMEVAALHLVKYGDASSGGLSWIVPNERLPLLGFAHGWSGIIFSLKVAMKYSRQEARQTIENCILSSVQFAELQFNGTDPWIDYRGSNSGENDFCEVNHSWCNGVPGILRGLMAVKEYCSPELNEKIVSSCRTLFSDDEAPARYCCGYFGEIDFCLDSFELDEDQFSKILLKIESSLTQFHSVPLQWEAVKFPEAIFPSLYQGKAGLIYTAARALDQGLPSLTGQIPSQKEPFNLISL